MSADMTMPQGVRDVGPAPQPARSRPAVRPQRAEVPERAQEVAEPAKAQDVRDVEKTTNQLNEVMSALNRGIRFKVNEETDRLYVQIVDRKSAEVVRTIPSEEMMRIVARLHDVLGMILDTEG